MNLLHLEVIAAMKWADSLTGLVAGATNAL